MRLYQYVNKFRLNSLPRIFLIFSEIQKQLFYNILEIGEYLNEFQIIFALL